MNEYLSNVNRLIQKRGKRIVDALKKQIPNNESKSILTTSPTQKSTFGKAQKFFLAAFSFIILSLVGSCISVAAEYQNAGGFSAIIQEYGYSAFIKDFIKVYLYTARNTFVLIAIIALVVYALFSLLRLLAKKFS